MKIKPGDLVDRAAIHAEFGGQTASRISPSKTSPNVFLFLDPAHEEMNGWICGATEDGAFHMVGEGTSGDHDRKRGNHVLLAHRDEGRPLRLFVRYVTGQFRYMGTFEVDRDRPFYRVDLPEEREPLVVREAYVFRLRPVGEHAPLPVSHLPRPGGTFHPREAMMSILSVKGDRDKTSLETRTESLLADYARYLMGERHEVVTVRLPVGDGTETLGIPLLDRTTDTVVISPGSSSRAAVRSAVGEALDLQRLTGTGSALLVLPSEPREDVLALIEHVGLAATWPVGREWQMSDAPAPAEAPKLR